MKHSTSYKIRKHEFEAMKNPPTEIEIKKNIACDLIQGMPIEEIEKIFHFLSVYNLDTIEYIVSINTND